MIFRPGAQLIIDSPGVQVLSLRPAGVASTWWDNNGAISGCVAAYQPKGAADLAASYVNLVNPGTNNAAPGTAPTWDATGGWTFNGSSQYLLTGVVPANNQTWSMMIRYSDVTAAAGFKTLAGVSWAGGQGFLMAQYPDATGRLYYNGGLVTVAATTPSGVRGVAGNQGYLNGATDGGTIPAAGGANTLGISIGALNSSGSFILHFPGKIQALSIYNATLSGANVGIVTTAMAAL